jgi:hypothetical protein
MVPPRINVLVTCTARKTLPPEFRTGSLSNSSKTARFDEWAHLLMHSSCAQVPAMELYAGSSWVPVKALAKIPGVTVWIASAGYGLITPETSICSYSATFSRNHPDFVGADDSSTGAQAWWSKLTQGNIKQQRIRSVCDLIREYPDTPLLAALSKDYWTALKSDFESAVRFIHTPYTVVLVSAGGSEKGPLAQFFLPCNATLERELGRGRSALNIRTLAHILEKYPEQVGKKELFDTFNQLLSRLDHYPYPKRRQTSDEEVKNFIKQKKIELQKVSHSSLLRQFRAMGHACEQGRFRELFKKINTI